MEPGTFTCSICGDPSQKICVYCTKDACGNHLCDRCRRCSDCCECGVSLSDAEEDLRESVAVGEPAVVPVLATEEVHITSVPVSPNHS